ncbi:sensor histidine kinase [Paenibacillus hexagrammi]|uniref:histidine kinase n=1 Tax=Paenibacillus hexagrammi TaxID=2908839 RepID=A0ABY3SN27_9BACL|nr:sensor histidine kinase [Paenibacillus sp. YPD9-1]UJF34611.1 sensor histidine kinase [Paenibacillus sp. YPD9-1]
MGRRFNSLHNRLFLLFLSCMMALLLIVSVLYYQRTTDIIHTKISDMAEKNISQTVGLFDLLLEGYDSITKALNGNYELLRLLEDHQSDTNPALRVVNDRTITNILGAIYYSRDDIVGIHVITNEGRTFNYERRFAGVLDANYSSSEWFEKLKNSTGEMVWLGIYPQSVINALQADPVFVFGRQLYDLTDHRSVGIVLIEASTKAINSAVSNVTISPNSQVYIVDKSNRIVTATTNKKLQSISFADLPRPTTNSIVVDNMSDQLIVAANATKADWTVYGLTPKIDINAEVVKTRDYLLYVILVFVMLSTILATIVSRNIASPVKLLIREMKQVEMGNFRGAVNVRSFEEINSLVSSFNRMVNRMDELIERITLASISEKNAELQALQSQVNPHFLYNTLDMIYWMLDERENDKLGRVILALSHMFRYSSDWQKASRTTLKQELDQMRHYMTIIENRLEGRVSTEIHVENRFLSIPLPKMTIQPIIENAVKSGLEPLDRPGVLRLYTEEKENELLIIIEDNGVGIEQENLTMLCKALENSGLKSEGSLDSKTDSSGMKRRGIGLPNVHRRIVLMFGDLYGLRVESKLGTGTTVTISVPLPPKGE